MNVSYTRHALRRMQERSVWDAEVELVISDHHTRYTDRAGNTILIGSPSGRRIKVVLAKDSVDPLVVITVGD
jgi:Domain of unknown function (DUF4258)